MSDEQNSEDPSGAPLPDLPLPDFPDLPLPDPSEPEDLIVGHETPVEVPDDAAALRAAAVVPIERPVVRDQPEPEETSRWPRFRVSFGRRFVIFSGIATLVVVGWLLVRTPTRAGLTYHPIGADGPAPTLIVLHGYGAPGTDFVPLGERVAAQLDGVRVLCVEAPYGVGFGNAWYLSENQRRRARDQLLRFVAELVDEGTPRAQIVVAGFSQGAAMATDVAVRAPGLAGVGILSGDHSTREPLSGRVFVSHGRGDAVLGFSAAERQVAVYEETAEVTFAPFDGGHEARPVEQDFIRWVGGSLGVE